MALFSNLRERAKKTPDRRIPPKRINPREKDPICPMIPIPAAMTPPPRRKPTGTVRETATFFIFPDPIRASAANPAGKNEVASMD
jgi:hypothetical protein